MKERYYISFNEGKDTLPKILQIFKEYGREKLLEGNYPSKIFFRHFYILATDPFLKILENVFKENNWELNKRLEREYSNKELMQCKLLALRLNIAPKGMGGPQSGTKFDISNACKICGTAALQISNLMLRPSDIPKNRDITQTYDFNILISKKLKEKFLKLNLKNVELIPVISSKDRKELGYYQILPKVNLPPFSESTKGIEIFNQCKICKRDGFYDSPEYPPELHYNNFDESFLNKANIFFTYEYFGNSELKEPFKHSILAVPKCIVSPKILELFSDLKIKGLHFEPVIVNGFPDLNKWKVNKNE
ncbi:hypothetical protein HYY71_03885 [Candidatus Woesearchaeota archaeon]|nr:hypothetical protein [Candidatus Woesearchaeota archaeon]